MLESTARLMDLWPARPLDGRVALITGCGRRNGIGAAIARTMVAAGASVVVADIARSGLGGGLYEPFTSGDDGDGLASLVDEIVVAGGKASMLLGDVASAE